MIDQVTTTNSSHQTTRFGAAAVALEARADELGKRRGALWREAGDQLESAGDRTSAAAAHLLGATVNLGAVVGHLGRGLVVEAAGRGVGHGVAGLTLGATGVAVRTGEEASGALGTVCHLAGRAFVGLANLLHRVVGNGRTVTVREIEGVGRERLSNQMWRAAGQELSASRDGWQAALGSFEQAVAHALGAGVNVAYVAGYSAMALGDVAQALAATGGAAACAAARQLNRLAALGVQAAEKGLVGAAELLTWQARKAAQLGNLLVAPKGGVELEVRGASRQLDGELRQRLAREPELGRLPAARELLLAPVGAH